MSRLVTALVAAIVLTVAPTAAAQSLAIGADPALSPRVHADVEDYVVRCDGEPVRVWVEAPPGLTVDVDGAGARGGNFVERVPLAEGQSFDVVVSAGGGAAPRNHHVRCLPDDFPKYEYRRAGAVGASLFAVNPGFGFGLGQSDSFAAVFSSHGAPVWWFRGDAVPMDAKQLEDGTVAWVGAGGYEIRSLDGRFLRNVATVDFATDPHDIQLLPNGNYMVGSYAERDGVDLSAHGGPASATVWDAEFQEISTDGELVWRWNSKDHVSLDETPGRWWPTVLAAGEPYDITHWNSIEVSGDALVVSMRHTDSVYEIDRPTGAIRWKLGGTPTAQSLEVVGDPLDSYPLGGQHDARLLADGTLTVHDNATNLGRGPRAVRYRLDRDAQRATLVEAVTDTEIADSFCCGSSRRLPGGEWLAAWGGNRGVWGYSAAGTRSFSLSFPDFFSYRANALPAAAAAQSLREAMNRMHPRAARPAPPPAASGDNEAPERSAGYRVRMLATGLARGRGRLSVTVKRRGRTTPRISSLAVRLPRALRLGRLSRTVLGLPRRSGRVRRAPGGFAVGRLAPGGSASISIRLYRGTVIAKRPLLRTLARRPSARLRASVIITDVSGGRSNLTTTLRARR